MCEQDQRHGRQIDDDELTLRVERNIYIGRLYSFKDTPKRRSCPTKYMEECCITKKLIFSYASDKHVHIHTFKYFNFSDSRLTLDFFFLNSINLFLGKLLQLF